MPREPSDPEVRALFKTSSTIPPQFASPTKQPEIDVASALKPKSLIPTTPAFPHFTSTSRQNHKDFSMGEPKGDEKYKTTQYSQTHSYRRAPLSDDMSYTRPIQDFSRHTIPAATFTEHQQHFSSPKFPENEAKKLSSSLQDLHDLSKSYDQNKRTFKLLEPTIPTPPSIYRADYNRSIHKKVHQEKKQPHHVSMGFLDTQSRGKVKGFSNSVVVKENQDWLSETRAKEYSLQKSPGSPVQETRMPYVQQFKPLTYSGMHAHEMQTYAKPFTENTINKDKEIMTLTAKRRPQSTLL